MKKLLALVIFLIGFQIAKAQYTYIAQRYEWYAGLFRGLGVPSGAGPAAFISGQAQRAGALYYDSVGVDSGLYVWSGLVWRQDGGYTDADARAAISLTTTGTSGAATYSSATGVFNIPNYTTTASEGITKTGSDFQLGQILGEAGTPALMTYNREIVSNSDSRYFKWRTNTGSGDNEVRIVPAGAIRTHNDLGGGMDIFINPTGAQRAFAGLNFYRSDSAAISPGNPQLAAFNLDLGPSTSHLAVDIKPGEINSFKIEMNGTTTAQWDNLGNTWLGALVGTKRTRFGSITTPTRTADITGSFAVSDSALFPNRLSISDTTGFDVAMLDRTTGLMKRIRADQLGIGGGGSQDLQAVTDAGSTTTNTITSNGNFIKPSYTSNWVLSEGFTGNGTSAYGTLVLREFSTGAGNTVTLSPLDMSGDIELFLPEENSGDTLATKAYARSLGGGGAAQNLSYNSGTHAVDIDDGGTSAVIPLATSSTNGLATTNQVTGTIGTSVDGMGSVITIGSRGFVTIPYDATITNWYVACNVSGSIQFDIKRSGTSIVGGGGNKPLLSSAISGNAAVSGWTSTAVTAGDILEWNIDSATTVSNCSCTLKVIK